MIKANSIKYYLITAIITTFLVLIANNALGAAVCDGGLHCAAGNQADCEAITSPTQCNWVVNTAIMDKNPLSYNMCRALDIATGTVGKAAMAFIIIALGIGFYKGAVTMAIMAKVGAGIATTFGSVSIVAAIAGADIYECIIEDDTGCVIEQSRIPENASPVAGLNVGETFSNNQILGLECNNGYFGKLYGIACFDNMSYGGAGFCEEADCLDPNDHNNLYLEGARWQDNPDGVLNGVTIQAIVDNYGFSGSATATCENSQYVVASSVNKLPTCKLDSSTIGYQDISTYGQWQNPNAGTSLFNIPDNEIPIGYSAVASCYDAQGRTPSDMTCQYQDNSNSEAKWVGGDDYDCSPPVPCPYSDISLQSYPLGNYGTWNVSGGTASEGETIQADCQYSQSLAPSLRCTFSGVWEYVDESNSNCTEPQSCDVAVNPYSISNGSWPTADDQIAHDQTLTANCNDQMSHQSPELKCNNGNWQWHSSVTDCPNLSCEVADAQSSYAQINWNTSNATNGLIAHNQTINGSTCNDGSAASPTAQLQCNDSLWDAISVIGCSNACTSNPTTYYNTNISWSGWSGSASDGSTISGSCTVGMQSSVSLDCSNGQWTNQQGDCTGSCNSSPTTSEMIGNITNINVDSISAASHGQNISNIECQTGYSKSSTISGTCQNGQWQISGGSCAQSCNNSEALAISLINGSWNSTSEETTISGQTLPGTCDSNYDGTPYLTCSNGNWLQSDVNCTINSCDNNQAPNFPNGYFSSGTTNAGHVLTGSCDDGYDGNPYVSCSSSGSWGNVFGSCTRITCSNSQAPNFPNGYFSSSGTTDADFDLNGSCDDGYDGNPYVSCSSSGSWGNVFGSCTRITCDNSSAVHYAADFPYDGSTSSGSSLTGSCKSGYVGSASAYCYQGNWSYNGVNCEKGCANADIGSQFSADTYFNVPNGETSAQGTIITGVCLNGTSSNGPIAECITNHLWIRVSTDCV